MDFYLGTNAYDIQISNVGNSGSYSKYNIGGFFEHQMTNHLGAKSYLLYTNTDNGDYIFYSNPDFNFKNTESKTLQLHLLMKYDVSKEYNKGFYVMGGLRTTSLLDVTSDEFTNLDDEFFKKTNYGVLLEPV
ncbi:outer membrane beta-barrel protein [Flavobacterium sp. RS13.1]|uniref:outer membrane beta-barrel protein n=1 Tax=Flavobacterium sp. RS13.1 TaxID=3400345 RepID=UPI003AAD7909